jgi:hypothetical protein
MATRIMNRLLGAVALGLAIAVSNIAADAGVRLPAGARDLHALARSPPQSGKPAVVTVSITGRDGRGKNSGQGPGQAANTRNLPAERQAKATGSGVIIDAEKD